MCWAAWRTGERTRWRTVAAAPSGGTRGSGHRVKGDKQVEDGVSGWLPGRSKVVKGAEPALRSRLGVEQSSFRHSRAGIRAEGVGGII